MAYTPYNPLQQILNRLGTPTAPPTLQPRALPTASPVTFQAPASAGGSSDDDSASGGTTAGSTSSGGASAAPPMPPFLSYPPEIGAQREALERGLEDVLQDTRRERRYAQQDTRTTIRDLRTERRRGMRDIGTERERGQREIGESREEINVNLERTAQDFNTNLTNLIHDYQVRGQQQSEVASAAGLTGGGTAAASAQARAENLARDRAPLDTALQRAYEDAAEAQSDLTTQESDLLSDAALAERRLRQDTRHDVRLSRRELARQMRDIRIRRQRARREEAIGQVDLAEQAIYAAALASGNIPTNYQPPDR